MYDVRCSENNSYAGKIFIHLFNNFIVFQPHLPVAYLKHYYESEDRPYVETSHEDTSESQVRYVLHRQKQA
jgi:hypothetical protein